MGTAAHASHAPDASGHHSRLYLQVLIAIALGVALGLWRPDIAVTMKPLGDGFIKLIKMLIGPIVFSTIVTGIAQTGAMKHVGRIGLRALLYFEVVSTLALVIGLLVVRTLQPGVGAALAPTAAERAAVASYAAASKNLSTTQFLLNIVPDSMVSAFTGGEILQVLLVSILFGIALLGLGRTGAPVLALVTTLSNVLFRIVGIVMRLAPIGAFGAMAYTVGNHGVESLLTLGKLLVAVYVTCALFIFVVLNSIAAWVGISLVKLLRFIGEEILIVLGTSSSESALPRLMAKLERLGCSPTVVGLVVPTGYSFNLDGTSIYMTMAAIFVAQISGVQLTLGQELGILALLLLTSKGAAAVTGSGFVTLAATLSAFPAIPVAGLASLLGVDRFMSEARAITNLIGNAVATLVVAKWDGALDVELARRVLDGREEIEPGSRSEEEVLTVHH
jgi:aerobic C4-dicarboxylate transport protein